MRLFPVCHLLADVFHYFDSRSVEGTDGECVVSKGGEGGRISSLGEGGRTRVQDDGSTLFGIGLAKYGQVGMTVNKYVAGRCRRKLLLVVDVTVGQEEADAVLGEYAVR